MDPFSLRLSTLSCVIAATTLFSGTTISANSGEIDPIADLQSQSKAQTVHQFYKAAGKLRTRAIYFSEQSESFSAYRKSLKDLNENLTATIEANDELIRQLSSRSDLSPEETHALNSLKYSQIENRNIIAAREKAFKSTKSQQLEFFKSREQSREKYSDHWSSLGQIAPCTATAPQYIDLLQQLDLVLQKDGSPQDVDISASAGLLNVFENRSDFFREKLRKYLNEQNALIGQRVELVAEESSLSAELSRSNSELDSKTRSKMSVRLKIVQNRLSEIENHESDALSMIHKNIDLLSESSRMELIMNRVHQAVHLPTRHSCGAVTDAAVAPAREAAHPNQSAGAATPDTATVVAQ